MTITAGTGALTAYGSGAAPSETAADYRTAVDTITLGAAGGSVTVGYGGAGGAAGGSEIVNISAATAKSVTLTVPNAATYGARATITGFKATASTSASDTLNWQGAYVANNALTGYLFAISFTFFVVEIFFSINSQTCRTKSSFDFLV
jgi:hypothetical protein